MKAEDLFEQRNNFYLNTSSTMRGGVLAAIVVGLALLGAGIASGVETTRVWGAVLFNTFFFFSIALGGVAFGGMQDLVRANWGRPIKRVHEAFGAFLPVAGVIFIGFLVMVALGFGGADHVYHWIHDENLQHFYGKRTWLQVGPFVARDVFAVVVILLLAFWHYRQTMNRDKALLAGDKATAAKLGKESTDRLRYWSAPILFVYAVCYTLLGFDLLMSLSYEWFSTLWGGWLFAIMMQTLMATILITMFSLQSTTIGKVFSRQQYHDVGKLMHGFTIFFAYLTYAHVLTYWYGNVPEETMYFINRLEGPWFYLVCGIPILAFVIPLFALIPKASKWTSIVTIPLASLILLAQWGTYMLVVQPETVGQHGLGFPTVELGALLTVLGLFLMSFMNFGRRHPMVSIADPMLGDALQGHH